MIVQLVLTVTFVTSALIEFLLESVADLIRLRSLESSLVDRETTIQIRSNRFNMHKLKPVLSIVTFLFLAISSANSTARAGLVVEFDTSLGAFHVELFDTQTPISVANFLNYANSGLYDNTIIHRSVGNFVIQGGGYDPLGSPIATFGPIVDEIGISNLRGTLAYANIGSPNTNVNQWFFNVNDNVFLDSAFTVFGKVLGDGMDIVDQINGLPLVNAGGPFNELPVMNPNAPLFSSNLVIVHSVTPNPEPGSMMLLLAGLTGVVSTYRCRRTEPTIGC